MVLDAPVKRWNLGKKVQNNTHFRKLCSKYAVIKQYFNDISDSKKYE